MASSKRDVHIVFLGPTGCGKSRLCNFLLNDDTAFKVDASFQSVTKACKLIDTQGLADTTMTNAEVIKIIRKAIKQEVTYINYFVIILRAGRLTDENRNALESIIKAFRLDHDERKKHVLLLLSHCECSNDQLMAQYEKEYLIDRTIKRLLIIQNNTVVNYQCIGLPQPSEVNEWMYDGIMKWISVQRKVLLDYLSKPIKDIQPVKESGFSDLCTIL